MTDTVEQPITSAPAVAPAPDLTPAPSPAIPETVAPAQADQVAAVTPKPAASESSPDAAGGAPAAAETPKTEEGFKPTLLDGIDKPKEEPKPKVEAEEAKPGDETQSAEVAPVELSKIDYWAPETGVKLPDTLKMDDTQRGELTAALDAFRADPTKGAQAIIDQGVKVIGNALEEQRRSQWTVWNDTQTEWQNQVRADPILGGAGHDTAMTLVGQGRNKLVSAHKPGTQEFSKDIEAFNEMARITGVGNHPVFLKILHRAGKLFAEAAPPPPDPRPAPDNGRRPGGKGNGIYTNTKFPGQA